MTKLENLNIGIFIDRDVTVRHFLDSEIFNGLKKDNNVKLIFPPLGDKRISSQKNAKKYGFDYQFISIPEKRILLWKWIFYIKTLSFKKGEDWKIIRAFSSYINMTLPYNNLDELRKRISVINKNLVIS